MRSLVFIMALGYLLLHSCGSTKEQLDAIYKTPDNKFKSSQLYKRMRANELYYIEQIKKLQNEKITDTVSSGSSIF